MRSGHAKDRYLDMHRHVLSYGLSPVCRACQIESGLNCAVCPAPCPQVRIAIVVIVIVIAIVIVIVIAIAIASIGDKHIN